MKLATGFIGLGNITERHVETVRAMPEFDLVGVCDTNEQKLSRWSTEPGCKGFRDYHDLLADPPDVVLVVTARLALRGDGCGA